jgi:hypothetical protein
MEIKFTIPDDKVSRVVNAICGLYPIPTETNPETKIITPLFTANQWAREVIKNWIINQVAKFEYKEQQKTIVFNPDNTLIS